MAYLVMERTFEPPLSEEDADRNGERLGPCMERYDVRWIHSYLSHTRERKICIFEAPDAEAVRIAFRMAGLPFERVWPAEILMPDAEPSPPGR